VVVLPEEVALLGVAEDAELLLPLEVALLGVAEDAELLLLPLEVALFGVADEAELLLLLLPLLHVSTDFDDPSRLREFFATLRS
jgi:hypothetical protein